MCGIIGYTGVQNCPDILINGLKKMEYRGYDSAGMVVSTGDELDIRKATGRIASLEGLIENEPVHGFTGIGHTRWATHGVPSFKNSHPLVDMHNTVAVVHNGIIENYYSLKSDLIEKGIVFATETDTEVVAQLIGYYFDGDMLSTLFHVLPMLEGTYAFGIVSLKDPEVLYCTRKESPLIVGKGKDGNFIASDASAILEYTRDIYYLDNLDIAKVEKNNISFYTTSGEAVEKNAEYITWDIAAAEKGGYDHFMLKEIYDQPKAIADTLNHYVDVENMRIKRELMPFTKEEARNLPKISILACGTAYHAGMVGKALIEKLARIPVDTKIASEFRYGDNMFTPSEAFIAVSQSGETADTIAAIKKAKEFGGRVVSFCNVISSSVARESDAVLYTLAGPEIAVASTKAYVTQVLLFTIIALDLAHQRDLLTDIELASMLKELISIPKKAELVLMQQGTVKNLAEKFINAKNVFFIGRLLDYSLSMEAALKLKEISYLHSEAYAAGELKHGTIALIEKGTLVIATATQGGVFEKTLSNIEEVRVRGAEIVTILGHNHKIEGSTDDTITLPETLEIYAPLLAVIPMQLFAYHMALERGCDIDKPRNLAKSVTVE